MKNWKSPLFKDGYREKSHFCVARYLEEKYVKRGKLKRIWVDLLDRFRELRRGDLYELEFFATKEDAKEAIENAEKFIKVIEKLI
jgi:uncharacterized protein (UPF0332 family)